MAPFNEAIRVVPRSSIVGHKIEMQCFPAKHGNTAIKIPLCEHTLKSKKIWENS
jgi:hypothetical protein